MTNTDENYRDLNADEFDRLLAQLEALQHRYTGPIGTNNDLTTLPLNTFIATSPAVLIINSAMNIPLPPNPPVGVYAYTSWNLYNSYANTPLSQLMAADQLDKFAAQRTSLDSPPFLLSWTITTPLEIRDDAAQANELLFDSGDEGLWKSVYNSKVGPNVVLVDGIGNGNRGDVLGGGSVLKGLCMAIMSVVLEERGCPASGLGL